MALVIHTEILARVEKKGNGKKWSQRLLYSATRTRKRGQMNEQEEDGGKNVKKTHTHKVEGKSLGALTDKEMRLLRDDPPILSLISSFSLIYYRPIRSTSWKIVFKKRRKGYYQK